MINSRHTAMIMWIINILRRLHDKFYKQNAISLAFRQRIGVAGTGFWTHVLVLPNTAWYCFGIASEHSNQRNSGNKTLESSDSRAFFLHLYLEKRLNYSRLSLLGGTAEYSAVQELVHEMDRGCRTSGVKRIHIHDLFRMSRRWSRAYAFAEPPRYTVTLHE